MIIDGCNSLCPSVCEKALSKPTTKYQGDGRNNLLYNTMRNQIKPSIQSFCYLVGRV